ncbi:MAG TPA: phosphonate ABC transporter ATP-binding protein [Caldimonas sp.]|nr:phosphonate ABC transporter ATP-binding protein [Caldimonas sp.]
MEAALVVEDISKTFAGRTALRGVSFRIERGEMVALLGASGSGKSTLMRQLNGLSCADASATSRIVVLGRELQAGGRLAADVRAQRARIAMVFQQFNLVDRSTVMRNVLVGAVHRLSGWRAWLRCFPQAEQRRALAALARVGIASQAWQRASTLSGGQQQRAAISRALVQGADIVLADEPIASLDPSSSRRVMALLAELNRELGVTVLVSLHQVDYAFAFCPRTIALRAGEVVYDGPTCELTRVRLRALYGEEADEMFHPRTDPIDSQPLPDDALQAA